MAYGIVKVDQITFTNGGVDQTITVSGIVQSISGNITATGTIQAATIIGTSTVSGATVTGNAGVFTTVTGGSAGFTTVTGTTVTGTTANFNVGTFTSQVSGTTVTGNIAQFTSITGGTAGFTTVTGTTVTGTTANFVTLSGTTVTGNAGQFTTITGGTVTLTSGVFGAGTAALPSIAFTGDLNTGIYSPGADQVAVATSGAGRLFIDSSGNVGVNASTIRAQVHIAGIGQSTANLTDAGSRGGMLRLSGTGASGGEGGALLFTNNQGDAANSVGFAAIKGLLTDGSNNTAGDLAFATRPTSASTSLQERLRITSAGLVGVGVSNPIYLLQAAGTIASVGSFGNFAALQTAGGTGFRWTLNNDGTFRLQRTLDGFANASVPIFIDSSDRVGIGTTSPVDKLEVRDGNISLDSAGSATADRTTERFFKRTDDGSANGMAAIGMNGSGTNGFLGEIKFYTGLSDVFNASLSERARLDSSGRLLVGTSSATNISGIGNPALQVQSTGVSAISCYNWDSSGSNGGGEFYLLKSKSGTVGTQASLANNDIIGTIRFLGSDGTNHIQAGLIKAEVDGTPGTNDMPGRLVFSTTADGASSPTERMRITSAGVSRFYSVGGNVLESGSSSAAGTSFNVFLGKHSATSTDTGTNSIAIRTNGNIENTNNSYGAFSDIKLKENIVDANSQWDDLKALQVRNYNFKEGQTHTQIGLVAQEVELVSPGLVTESPDRDAEGNDLGTVTKSVNYSVLYMKAVKALQEAMERIEVLEAKVAALESV